MGLFKKLFSILQGDSEEKDIENLSGTSNSQVTNCSEEKENQAKKKVKKEVPDCSIYVWTGYEYGDLSDLEQLKYIDKLICGKFIKKEKCDNPMYGSNNQYIVDVQKPLNENKCIIIG